MRTVIVIEKESLQRNRLIDNSMTCLYDPDILAGG